MLILLIWLIPVNFQLAPCTKVLTVPLMKEENREQLT